jgi:GT2 family glycosyltransferase
VLLLLNSDTEVDERALDAMLEAFDRDPRLGIAGAQLRYPGGEPQWSGGPAPGPLWLFYQASGLHPLLARLPGYRRARPLETAESRDVGWVTGAALAMRREVWNQVGPFDEGFKFYGQDLDLCLRAGAAGWRVSIVAAFTVMHHHGATIGRVAEVTARQDPVVMWHDLLYWTRKHGGETSARRARRAILCGGWLRVLARRVVAPAMPSERRPEWRRQTDVLRSAIRSLRRPDPL